MKLHEFVFTKKVPAKYYRHISFWLGWYIFLTLHFLLFLKNTEVPPSKFVTIFTIRTYVFLGQMIYTYTVVYFLLPKYAERKNTGLFFTITIGFALAIHSLTALIAFYYLDIFSQPADIFFLDVLNQARNFIRTGPIIICSLFLCCKMLKKYYIKLEERTALVKENADAELQLLKAQVHPHFLFNTLNNIYSSILNKSPQSATLVTKLSGTLHYMINECEAALVPLEKELKMITDYTGLEKIRYGDRLKMDITITGGPGNKMIAPLLLIPFLENSFKHGTSKMLIEPWIKLFIQADENILHFSLTNSKPVDTVQNGTGGIGLNNVRKRLELLYPNNHLLIVEFTKHTFTVNMQVPLENIKKEVVA